MKALQIIGYGDVGKQLKVNNIDKPKVSDNKVLIEVHGASVNPIDYKIVQGALKQLNKLEFPAPIGFDVAGEIVEVGRNVKDFKVGDQVYSRVPTNEPGSIAEYIAVDSTVVTLKPQNVSYNEAAGFPLVGLTTIQAFNWAKLKKGDKVLIHAGSGGIGTFAIQYAKSQGAFVYTTTSTKNVKWVKELGADVVIDYKKENYLDVVKDVDIVYDTLGGDYTEDAFKVIKVGGSVASLVGPIDKETAVELGLNPVFRFVLSFGAKKVMKAAKSKEARYKMILMSPNKEQLDKITTLVQDGKIKPIIDKTFSLDKAIDALLYQKSGRAKGKVIVQVR